MSESQFNQPPGPKQAPRLLERLRLQARGYGLDMQNRYVEWCRQLILFHQKRHPTELAKEMFGNSLRIWRRGVCPWAGNGRLGAVGFLYREEVGRVIILPELRRCFPESVD